MLEPLMGRQVEWIAQAVDGGDFSDSSVYQGPCFTLVATSVLWRFWSKALESARSSERKKRSQKTRQHKLYMDFWAGQAHADSSAMSSSAEVVRGFARLEDTLDHYFSPKVIEDGGLRVRTMRKFRRMNLGRGLG